MNHQADSSRPFHRNDANDANDDEASLSDEDELSEMYEDEDLFEMAFDWQVDEGTCVHSFPIFYEQLTNRLSGDDT